ncbi:hypothetical protein D1872_259450 [compost metagenome]
MLRTGAQERQRCQLNQIVITLLRVEGEVLVVVDGTVVLVVDEDLVMPLSKVQGQLCHLDEVIRILTVEQHREDYRSQWTE